jgi:hypothetical protein
MELIYNLFSLASSINLYSFFKVSFVFFLFVLNIYLIITYKKEESNKSDRVLQSGFGNKNLNSVLGGLVTLGGFLSAVITVKNELKNVQIGKLDQLNETEREGIRKSIDKDREEHQRILSSILNNREELYKLHNERAKLVGHNDRLLTLHNNLKDNVVSYQDKSIDPSTKLSDLGIIDQLIKQDTEKFGLQSRELNSLVLASEGSPISSSVSETSGSTSGSIPKGVTGEPYPSQGEVDNLKESSSFPFNFELHTVLGWFEGLNGIKKIAVSMIIGKSVVFSALISIIFIFYGNILIEKYDLENRFPKLATIIRLRQKFQKYYFIFYCGLIFFIIIVEVAFSLTILLL